ncbi:MAG: D-glucuronyl C5-epimerase family protein [Solirubrobacteraceae bacterium]
MRRISVAGLALAILLVLAPTATASPLLTLRADGSSFAREDRYLPAPQAAPGARANARRAATGARANARRAATAASTLSARAAADRPRRTVRRELRRMLKADAIDRSTYDAHRATYADARRLRRKLSGARRSALDAVLDNLENVAARGDLTVSRLPALFETVARNREWWSNGPLLSYGQRVSFSGSPLVWQYYTGEGLQIQWLGTFGKANALWKSGKHDSELGELLDAATELAARRAGGIAFEYLFDFDGGRPPWVSGLAQATGVQALSRAAVRLNEPRYFEAARAGLGIFRTAPPTGVRVKTSRGAHYLIYSFAPRLRVLNAFTQAVNGLHDFAILAKDAPGAALYAAGEAQLRSELPRYDTGAWSRYSLHREADLGYHKLARDFLRNLCTRLRKDEARRRSERVPDPARYCSAAKRFSGYLKEDPVISLVSRRARAGRPASLKLKLSKPAFVKLAVKRGERTLTVLSARLGSGRSSLRWNRPRRPGSGYEVMLRATDLAGNVGSSSGELKVLKERRKRKRRR